VLDQAIVLGMIGGGLYVLHTKQGAQSCQREEVNWTPLSEVMTAGTPKRDNHPSKRAAT
jgi:hypothetical protein